MSKTLSNSTHDPGPFRTRLSRGLVLFVAASAPLWLIPGARAQALEAKVGSWSAPFPMLNVAVHAHVLPTGKVLFWGRRELGQGLDTPDTTPHLWDPVTGKFDLPAPPPTPMHNIFCSGHAFLPDGRLLVTGGAIVDGDGLKNASLYDPVGNNWTPVQDMNAGRWYPTALALANGDMLVASGSFKTFPLPGRPPGDTEVNDLPQVLDSTGHWRDVKGLEPLPPPNNTGNDEPVFPLYPFLHVAPDGNVFMSGPLVKTSLVDVVNGRVVKCFLHAKQMRAARMFVGERDFGSSVMYDVGKVLVVGGHSNPPTATAEVINLNDAHPMWRFVGSLSIPRRQLNATILADGKVLVIGGTSGFGNDDNNFNDLETPVLTSELWDPAQENHWTVMAKASVARQYHSTAVLLPDATVLSAGGGEYAYADENTQRTGRQNNHRDAQIYSPPYLFNANGPAPRPVISSAPGSVVYGEVFPVGTPAPGDIKRVTWVRLSSVTHAYDQNQRFNNLAFKADATGLQVTAPPSGNHAPPGHYMLFLLDGSGVPSVAKIIRISK